MKGTRKELAQKISEAIGLPNSTTTLFVNSVITNIIDTVIEKKKLTIRGFGTFKYKIAKERHGMNLKTMQKIKIKERYIIAFCPSKKLNRYINEQ